MPGDNGVRSASLEVAAKKEREGILLPTFKSNGLSMTARTQGLLKKIGSCLVVDHGDRQSSDILVFPEGLARWSESDKALTYKGKTTRIGDRIDIAGGLVSLKNNEIAVVNLAEDCKADTVWIAG